MNRSINLNDEITIYTQQHTSDNTGGVTATEVFFAECFAFVEPMSGNFGMNWMQLTGTKGYNVWVRTDFARNIRVGHIIHYKGIYGDIRMIVHDMDVRKTRTKLLCKGENRV